MTPNLLRCTTEKCKTIHDYPKDLGKSFTCFGCKKSINLANSVGTVKQAEELYKKGAEYMEVL